jgi:uncharacterized protein with NAD-binding domain and iron-sulfur cluster
VAEKKKVCILGGGVASMVTAFELTSAPDWQEHFDVTVHQLGWRLGGKGASGRNLKRNDRIEEHGLHLFFGYYDNAFRVMRRCYEELGRPPGAPLATWQDAFKKRSLIVGEHAAGSGDYDWILPFPENSAVPGDGGVMPTPWNYIEEMIQLIADLFHRWWLEQRGEDVSEQSQLADELLARVSKADHGLLGLLSRTAGAGLERVGTLLSSALGAEKGLLHLTLALIRHMPRDVSAHHHSHHRLIVWLIGHFRRWLAAELEPLLKTNKYAFELFVSVDFFASIAIGLIEDDMILPPVNWHKIDDQDFCAWLKKAGAADFTAESALTRVLADAAFAVDTKGAAGTSVYMTLRLIFTYKGSVMWEMQASMGDTIFGPLYLVLKQRGVKFRFFHSVENLGLGAPDAAGKRCVERITIGRQATLAAGVDEYDPLVELKGLPCWPSEPRYEQLAEGAALIAGNHNLENWWGTWQNPQTFTLERGKDFDICVLGIGIGAFPYICKELIDDKANPRFGRMVEQVETTLTQGVQLWMKPTIKAMGWDMASPVAIGLPEPLDTWSDMSFLVKRESWQTDSIGSIAYLCSRLEDEVGFVPPPRSDHAYPYTQLARVKRNAVGWLEQSAFMVWPKVATPGSFDWSSLCADETVEGAARLDEQFLIADWNPSDRYVLAPVGNAFHRLRPQDSGYANLVLTGDWTLNSFSLGCVEAATAAGMHASRVLCGRPHEIVGNWLDEVMPPDQPNPGPPPTPPAEVGAPYIRRLGDLIAPQPYLSTGTTMRWFVLEAEQAALQRLCDQQLNIGRVTYRPLMPVVAFVAAEMKQTFSLDQSENTGWIREMDYGFWVPLVAGEVGKHGFEPQRIVWFQPYLWVDSGAALTAGREIFGMEKSLGELKCDDGSPPSFDVRTLVTTGAPGSQTKLGDLIHVHAPAHAHPSIFERFAELAKVGEELALLIARGLGLAERGGIPFDLTFLDDLLHGRMTMVALKQFPKAETLDEACYQAIVETPSTPHSLVKGHWLTGQYQVDIKRWASHEVVRNLGIKASELDARGWQSARAIAHFQMEFDFVFGRGKVVARTA